MHGKKKKRVFKAKQEKEKKRHGKKRGREKLAVIFLGMTTAMDKHGP